MPVTAAHPVIDAAGSADTVIAGDDFRATSALIRNPATNVQAVYLGPPGVTTATGYKLDPGDPPVSFELDAKETVAAVTAAGTATLDVIKNQGTA